VVKVLEANGFTLARRESHDTFKKPGHRLIVSVPRDEKELPKGTLAAIWRAAGIDPNKLQAPS
jgi:predicted RNA binding protein YcfA (HicA-like mRNA interferase family)